MAIGGGEQNEKGCQFNICNFLVSRFQRAYVNANFVKRGFNFE
jgi:hypothetical protein